MADPELILPLEQTLRRMLRASGYLPAELPIFCAHEAELISEAPDYIVIQAGRPMPVASDDSGNFETGVELTLYTGALINEAARPDAVTLHDSRAATLEWIFDATSVDALNAPIDNVAPQLGFSGWDRASENPSEDGRVDNTHLTAKLRYTFDVHRL